MHPCDHIIETTQHHFGWDRDNTAVIEVESGATLEFRIVDTAGGELTPESTVEDLDKLDHSRFTPLTGPVAVRDAAPGDAIKITFLDFRLSGWGWSMVTPRYGILADEFDEPYLHIWNYHPNGKQPADYKGIARIPIRPFPGIIGLCPGAPAVHPSLPPRNVGGNLDMKELTRDTIVFLPVETPGGLLSLGDTHAAQGHGELAGTALESPMDVAIRVELVKDARLHGPRLEVDTPLLRHVDGDGFHIACGINSDLREAARMATRDMIEFLGRSRNIDAMDAYLLCSVCGDLCISEMVNAPVNVVSLYFPKSVLT